MICGSAVICSQFAGPSSCAPAALACRCFPLRSLLSKPLRFTRGSRRCFPLRSFPSSPRPRGGNHRGSQRLRRRCFPLRSFPSSPPPRGGNHRGSQRPQFPLRSFPSTFPPRRGKVAPPANSHRLRCRCFPLPSFPSSPPPRGGNPSSHRPHFQVWSLVSSPSTRICKHSSSSSQQECIRRHHHRPPRRCHPRGSPSQSPKAHRPQPPRHRREA